MTEELVKTQMAEPIADTMPELGPITFELSEGLARAASEAGNRLARALKANPPPTKDTINKIISSWYNCSHRISYLMQGSPPPLPQWEVRLKCNHHVGLSEVVLGSKTWCEECGIDRRIMSGHAIEFKDVEHDD